MTAFLDPEAIAQQWVDDYVGRRRANEDGTPQTCADPAVHAAADAQAGRTETSWWRRSRGWCPWCQLRLPGGAL
ncbi:MAG TPA: hypothetical protein VFY85_11565 [Gemmatimonadaceae bacterium]|nr:hypothetical protein [Gemmatimonadaceae bacterium]